MTQIHKLFKMQYKKPAPAAVEAVQEPVEEIPVAQGVSVNKASLEALVAVNGLGEAMAQQIIEGRPWAALEDLTAVRGISKAGLERWTELTL